MVLFVDRWNQVEKIYKVKGEERYVIHISEYQNGIETTGGFYSKDELEVACNAISITYDSKHATELPLNWPYMKFLDDNNNRQFIKDIRFETDGPAYIMQDGTLSNEVTE